MKAIFKFKIFSLFLLQTLSISIEDEFNILQKFKEAIPIHPTIRTPEVISLEESLQNVQNQHDLNVILEAEEFVPYEGCSMNITNLEVGSVGQIKTPNYPRNYPARSSCEWLIEAPENSKIEVTFFDVVTQPWFFTYFDYILVSRNGDFSSINETLKSSVDRMSGDLNRRTPFTIVSNGNKFGVRFKSSALFNYRGMKLVYYVIPTETEFEEEPFDGICGQSETLLNPPPTTTEVPPPNDEEESTVAPILTPPGGDDGLKVKIVGTGNEAVKNSFPWMAALLVDGKYFCGGSLIDSQHVMTAAHCTDGAKNITMLLGVHSIRSRNPDNQTSDPGRLIISVTSKDIFQHPDYNPNTITHDISVIRLPSQITFTDKIKPICLPTKNYLKRIFVGDDVKVSGWGKTADDSNGISPVLNFVDLKVMSNSQCRATFRSLITGNLICTSTSRDKSPCKGDSGGPLIVKKKSKRSAGKDDYFMQVGIVSFGSLSCEKGLPVGFTRVSAFLEYISSVTGRKF